MSVILYGPAGCGKTTVIENVADLFNLTRIMDNFSTREIIDNGLKENTLYVCTHVGAEIKKLSGKITFLHYDHAKILLDKCNDNL